MKTLIVEDDFTSRILLQQLMAAYGESHVAVNGAEAVQAFAAAQKAGAPYDLVCLDIMMPEMDGQEALQALRQGEEAAGVRSTRGTKIIMTTALDDPHSIINAFYGLCDGYLVKPIDSERLAQMLEQLGLIKPPAGPAGVDLILP